MAFKLSDYGNEISAGGDIIQGIGAYLAGEEINAADEYNAQILDEQANQVMVAAGIEETQIGKSEAEYLSTQKALYTKAGVTMSGSPMDVALNTATNFEYDKLISNYNAKVQAANLESKASNERYYGKIAKNQAMFSMGKSLLEGGMALGGIKI